MKKRKKKKFSIYKLFITLMVLAFLYFIGAILVSIKTKNIVILGNSYYSDDTSIVLDNYRR